LRKPTAVAGLERAAAPHSSQESASPLGSAGPRSLRVAMIGTRGVPARYGGFETAVEEIGRRLVTRGHAVTVFCRRDESRASSFDGMRLVHIPVLRLKVGETLSRTALSMAHTAARHADVAIVFNAANAPLLPVLRAAGVPVALNVDGLEWKRAKWSGAGRRYYLACEKIAVRLANELIADAPGIQDYYLATHGVATRMIPYGANVVTEPALGRLQELGLRPCEYHLVVARLEPENNVHIVLEGYRRGGCALPLVIVGAAPYAKSYVRSLSSTASADSRIRMLGAIWDQELLDALYAGASTYVHGHSVGGTNPGLLRAMGAGACVLAYDVRFNRDVLDGTGMFWTTAADLALALAAAESDRPALGTKNSAAIERVAERYSWDAVTAAYEEMCLELAGRAAHGVAGRTARS
jgi:glycosyltransferase involved in cell wall biosynthesis